jgi:hypothetical protein
MKGTLLAVVLALSAGDIEITGPAKGKANEEIDFQVTGLPDFDLSKTLEENLAWRSKLNIVTDSPPGAECKTRIGLEIDFLSMEPILTVRITPFQAGEFVIIADWNEEPFSIETHRISITGRGPPDPEGPEDPPTVSKVDKVTYVWEKDETRVVPPPIQAVLIELNRDQARKIQATAIEKDSRTGTNEIPEQYKVAIGEALKVGLPACVIEAGDRVVAVLVNPTAKQILEAIK